MTDSTATTPPALLVSQLCSHLGVDPLWDAALHRLRCAEASLHLAVLTEPFLGWLLDGTKPIESRFSRVRCAPYGTLAEGDVIAVKQPGGPVTGAFQAGQVSSYQLTPSRVSELRERFAGQIRAHDDEFWRQRADCLYATLVQVRHARALPGLAFPKKDRRGWAQLTHARTQLALLSRASRLRWSRSPGRSAPARPPPPRCCPCTPDGRPPPTATRSARSRSRTASQETGTSYSASASSSSHAAGTPSPSASWIRSRGSREKPSSWKVYATPKRSPRSGRSPLRYLLSSSILTFPQPNASPARAPATASPTTQTRPTQSSRISPPSGRWPTSSCPCTTVTRLRSPGTSWDISPNPAGTGRANAMGERFTSIVLAPVILRRHGKILLLRRAGQVYVSGQLCLPSGHLEDGENILQAAIREAPRGDRHHPRPSRHAPGDPLWLRVRTGANRSTANPGARR